MPASGRVWRRVERPVYRRGRRGRSRSRSAVCVGRAVPGGQREAEVGDGEAVPQPRGLGEGAGDVTVALLVLLALAAAADDGVDGEAELGRGGRGLAVRGVLCGVRRGHGRHGVGGGSRRRHHGLCR